MTMTMIRSHLGFEQARHNIQLMDFDSFWLSTSAILNASWWPLAYLGSALGVKQYNNIYNLRKVSPALSILVCAFFCFRLPYRILP